MSLKRSPNNLRARIARVNAAKVNGTKNALIRDLKSTNLDLSKRVKSAEAVAFTDGLTGLLSIVGGDRDFRVLSNHLYRLNRKSASLAQPLPKKYIGIISIDLDHFKSVNDKYGHAVGDDCLVSVGRVIENEIRSGDLAIRNGGEELLVFLDNDITSLEQVAEVASRIKDSIEKHGYMSGGIKRTITASMGIDLYDPEQMPDLDVKALAEHATIAGNGKKHVPLYKKILGLSDELLYWAKANGRNCICYMKNGWVYKYGQEQDVLVIPESADKTRPGAMMVKPSCYRQAMPRRGLEQ